MKTYTCYSFRLSRDLIRDGFKLVDIDVNKKFEQGVQFYFDNEDGRVEEYVKKWNELKKI